MKEIMINFAIGSSLRCKLSKMQAGVAFIRGNDEVSIGYIDFVENRLQVKRNEKIAGLAEYNLIKR